MKTIKDIITSPYKGSEKTYEMVQEQLRERYGDDVADNYNAYTDVAPFSTWASANYRIRKGEHALKSITFVEVLNAKGEVEKKIRRTCNLFHRKQVERIA